MSSASAFELIQRVSGALSSAGLVADDIDLSGELTRCGTTKKPRGMDGAYKVHLDWPPNVWVCNYHDGGEGRIIPLWDKGDMDGLTEAEREAMREHIRQEKEENAQRLENRRKEAQERANEIFQPLPHAGKENAYLSRKGVLPMGDLRQTPDGRLVVPVLNAQSQIVNLQFIAGDGRKLFLKDGRKNGCFFPIPARDNDRSGPLLIGEGVATVLSVCMATGMAGLAAFDCGNLEAVARVARGKYPEREIILCADNDCQTTGRDGALWNPGVEAATEAARAAGGKLAVCPAHDGQAADFNDLHAARGLNVVQEAVEKAREQFAVSPPEGFLIRENANGVGEAPRLLPSPPPVPLEAFPPQARTLIMEAADAFTVPPQVPAATLLALLSCMVGRTRRVEVKRGWREHGNIWVVLVASSGLGKTPVMHAFFRPLEELEVCGFKEWKAAMDRYNQEYADYSRAKKEERGPLPRKPRRVQYYLDDSTVEALADALDENPRGVMWRVDELSGMLSSFDKYSSSSREGGTRARLLSAYDCQSWKSNRRNEEKNLHIPAACVSIFGGLQPGMLRKSFNGSDADSGFLPRFMFIRADRERPSTWSEKTLSLGSYALLDMIVRHLSEFTLNRAENGEEAPYTVSLSPEAKKLFVEWFDALAREDWEALAEGANDAIRQKLKGQALRLCLLLHCLDAAICGGDGLGPIAQDVMRRALLLADWVKENQFQTWTLLNDEGARACSPVERAIMDSLVADAGRIEADGWKISNARLMEQVNKRLAVKTSPELIGKAASSLGLAPCWVGGKGNQQRGRSVPREKIDLFKTTVVPVVPVVRPTGARAGAVQQVKNELLYLLYQDGENRRRYNRYNSSENNCSTPETVEAVSGTTGTTGTTVTKIKNAGLPYGEGVRWVDENTVEIDP